jgi:putative endopeptidase
MTMNSKTLTPDHARRIRIIVLSTLCLLLAASLFPAGSASTGRDKAGSLIDREDMDLSVRPGDDFFRYANGGWIDRVRIPDDRSSYRLKDIMYDRNREDIRRLLETVIHDGSVKKGSVAQKIRDLYLTGMDRKAAEAEGFDPLREELDLIAGMKSVKDLPEVLARLHTLHLSLFFSTSVAPDLKESDTHRVRLRQGRLGLPGKPYYLTENARAAEIRKEYEAHLACIFELLGEEGAAAVKLAKAVLRIETRLARASLSRAERRDVNALYNRKTQADLEETAPDFGWRKYFAALRGSEAGEEYAAIGDVVIESPSFFADLSRLIREVPLDELKAYLRANLVAGFSSYMSEPFAAAHFRFHSAFLSGKKERKGRKEMVTETVSQGLGELIGRLYVEEYFPPEAKEKMVRLTGNLKSAFAFRIKKSTWMSAPTKKAALEKLADMRFRIGYPEKWKDYSGLEIGADSFVLNLKRIARFLYSRNLARLGQAPDREEWILDPQTPNAGYAPQRNEIIFPAGFLQPPVFDMNADAAVVYGSIGVGIAHEMTHGFDDQGRKFDKDGNLNDWWAEEDVAEFNRQAQLLIDQYDGLTTADGIHPDGTLTLGENIADFGGLTIAWAAYTRSLEGRTPSPVDGFDHDQRFFLAFARFFRGKIRDEALRRMVVEDKHPWNAFRVNGALFNVPDFYSAFSVEPRDRLYRREEQRPVFW